MNFYQYSDRVKSNVKKESKVIRLNDVFWKKSWIFQSRCLL